MKHLFFICSFMLLVNISSAQVSNNKLIGVWQINTPQLADAWLNTYRFFNDGTFKYAFNQYDDSGRILAIKGTYKIKNDTLTLIVKTRTERIGGNIVQGGMGSQQNELVLDGARIIEVKQTDHTPIVIPVKFALKKDVRAITLQNNTYYLVSTDPHKEEN